MVPVKVAEGRFRMLSPCRSVMGKYIICGAIVQNHGFVTYTKRVSPIATRDDLRRAYGSMRDQIHREHPGVKEEFTMLRPKTSFN